MSTIQRRAKVEKWTEKRSAAQDKADADIIQITASKAADNAALAAEIKHRLLVRLQRTEEKFPIDATEVRQVKDGKTLVYRLRDITRAYKDLLQDEPTGDMEPVQVIIDV